MSQHEYDYLTGGPTAPTTTKDWGQPAPDQPQPRQPKQAGTGFAVTSLVTSIIGLFFIWVPVFGVVLPVIATAFGAVGLAMVIRRRWASGKGMDIAGLVMGILGILASVLWSTVFVAAMSSTTDATPAPKAKAAASAPATHQQTMQEWLAGPGGDNLYTVQDDLAQFSKDALNYDLAAVKVDGGQLADDAATAQTTPPPHGSAAYKRAMTHFIRSGNLAQLGDLEGASAEVTKGGTIISHLPTA